MSKETLTHSTYHRGKTINRVFFAIVLGLGLSQAFRMPQAEAIGVIIQSICPGGIYSNIVSYYLDGNINLR